MDKTDRLRDYGLAFLLYEHGLGVCGYELIRELFIFIKLILNSYLYTYFYISVWMEVCIFGVLTVNLLTPILNFSFQSASFYLGKRLILRRRSALY